MKISKFFFKITYIFLSLLFITIALEVTLRFTLGPTITTAAKTLDSAETSSLYSAYSDEELSEKLPYRHEYHGGKCTDYYEGYKRNTKLRWHPRYGFSGKTFDINCINNLFLKNTKNIVFFGGSTIQQAETPNYLTSIEYYTFESDLEKYRSINFGMSGARISNSLSIFLEYIPKIKNVDTAIFFDGINEFHSIKFGGDSTHDFYWTAGVSQRIHNPPQFFLDVLSARSKLFEIIFINIFNFQNQRKYKDIIEENEIIKSANEYLYRKNIIKGVCKTYNIECIFILQPNFYLTKNKNVSKHNQKINNFMKLHYPNNAQIMKSGYSIISKDKDILDFTNTYDDLEDTYFDDAHTNKIGSKVIGLKFKKILLVD